MPFGTQTDTRFNLVNNQIWISTEGHYGCRVSLKGKGIKHYSFPSWAKKAFLPIPVEQIPLIEKITYCVMPEFILYDVPLEAHCDAIHLKRTTEQVSISAIPEHHNTVEKIRFSTELSPHIQLVDNNDIVRLIQTTEKIRISALPEPYDTVEKIRFNTDLSSHLADILFKERTHLNRAETRLFYNIAQLHDKPDMTHLKQTAKQVRISALPEQGDRVKKMQVGAELASPMAPVTFKTKTTPLNMDEVPLDMWALDVNVLAPPVFMGDPRLREEAGQIILEATGQRGCLVSYADGKMGSYEFPAGAREIQLPYDGSHAFKDIVKIVFV
ncbi:hypothetical protein Xedl_03381 [Xenorhabdus eapokensis]|uniref:Uncharacterized protein n=1 Tax=Xenorhabdus eapokensis TaxID=1873482 RepID=A0A1Q5TIY1_9GAMM|nr:hypothetical protein Xedl_03381 [Xenorhabdus eapokensis]